VKNNFEVFANTTGIVSARRVNTGDYISPGSVLFDVADLSQVWVMFDAYESDLPYLSQGQKVSFTFEALPGKDYSGNISFIDPVLDPVTRVARVRVEIGNQGGKLKPEMFATGIVKATLNQYKNKLVIPRSAVLWTGKRSIVYVKQAGSDEPIFKMREIEIGPSLGNSYVVENGLMDGEEIVTQGTFSVDASAQLEGKPSMMNPEGGKVSTMPGMDMPGDTKAGDTKNMPVKDKPVDTKSKDDKSMPGMDMPENPKSKIQNPKSPLVQHATFEVSGNCEMCKDRIEEAARSVKGVTTAVWDVKTKKIDVAFSSNLDNVASIQKAIARVGHDTGKYKADDKVYNALPACCKYRK
jgi:Cu(I)/Ag(I) efflux system membrane fusion protein